MEEGKNIEITTGGLVCDNPKCDWEDMTIKFEDYEKYVNAPCPKCGENILTEEDYKSSLQMHAVVDLLNQFSPEEIDAMVKNMSPDQMDQALDKMNELGLKKVGENEDGSEHWQIKHDKHKDND